MPRLRTSRGFTLIELLVVILIIGVLVAVAAPSFLGQTSKAHDSVAKQYLAMAWKAAKAGTVENAGLYTPTSAANPASSIVSTISASEPEIAVTVGQPQSGDKPSQVYVSGASSADYVSLCNLSGSGTYWTLYASSTGQQHFVEGTSCQAAPPLGCVIGDSTSSGADFSNDSTGEDPQPLLLGSGGQAQATLLDFNGFHSMGQIDALPDPKYHWDVGETSGAAKEKYGHTQYNGTYEGNVYRGVPGAWPGDAGEAFNAEALAPTGIPGSPSGGNLGNVWFPEHPSLSATVAPAPVFTLEIWIKPRKLHYQNDDRWNHESVTFTNDGLTHWFPQGIVSIGAGTGWALSWRPNPEITQSTNPMYDPSLIPQSGDLEWSGFGSVSAAGKVAFGKWSQVDVVGTGTELRLFVNGVRVGTASESGGSDDGNASMYLGALFGNLIAGGDWEYFKGSLDELTIFNSALTDQQISGLHTAEGNPSAPTLQSDPTITFPSPLAPGDIVHADPGTWTPGTAGLIDQWQRSNDGGLTWVDIPGANSSDYTVGATDGGFILRDLVTAISGDCSTAAVTEVTTTVLESPVATTPPTIANSTTGNGTTHVQVSDQLSVDSLGTWSGSPTSYAYSWQVADDQSFTTNVANVGSPSQPYTVQSADLGKYLRLTVQAHNKAGDGTASSDVTNAVIIASPQATTQPLISDADHALTAARVGDHLSTTDGTWSGSPSGLSYQWQRSTNGTTWTGGQNGDISGATTSSYVVQATDQGFYLRVVVQAQNTGGSGSSASSNTAFVPDPPANQTQPQLSGTAQEFNSPGLQTSTGNWTGTATINYSYQWFRCDAASASTCQSATSISGATSQSYVPQTTDVGSKLMARVTAANAGGTQSADSTLSATVVYAPPTVTAAAAISAAHNPPKSGDTLTASASFSSSDSFTKSYQWIRCDSNGANCANVGTNSATYGPLANAEVSSTFKVTVTATNNTAPNAATSSTSALTGGIVSGGISLSFGTPLSSGLGATGQSGVVADFNVDGKPDFMAGRYDGGSTQCNGAFTWFGAGNNTFGTNNNTVLNFGCNNNATGQIGTGDVNGDGKLDIVSSITSISDFLWWTGNGNGTFSGSYQNINVSGRYSAQGILVQDLNGDGRGEVVDNNFGNIGVYSYDGTSWTRQTLAPTGVTAVGLRGDAVGDLNGDGKPDIVTLNWNGSNASDDKLVVFKNNGSLAFASGVNYSMPAAVAATETLSGVALADMNGDGKLDAVAYAIKSTSPIAAHVIVFLGNGDGTFQAGIASAVCSGLSPVNATILQAPAIADFNKDGALDVAANCYTNTGVADIALGDGSGALTGGHNVTIAGAAQMMRIFATDWNLDGKPDLITLVSGGTYLAFNNGS